MPLFTDKLLTNLKPREKRYVIWEENHRRLGTLGVRVSRSGRRTWIFMYRFSGRARMATLGVYPLTTVATAHAAASVLMEALERGQDPTRERLATRRELQRMPTVEKLAGDFIELYAKRRKRTWQNDQGTFAKHVIPRIGHLKANDIRRRDVIKMLEEIAVKAPTGANRVLALVRKMYNWAVEREICEYNPCYRLSRPSPENTRDRVLNCLELKAFWQLLSRDTPPPVTTDSPEAQKNNPDLWVSRAVRLALKLALVTVQRRAEIALAARSEFDMNEGIWTIPAARSKNGKIHRVPLSNLAMGIVRELMDLAGDSDWLLPSPRNEGKEPINAEALTRANARLSNCMAVPHFSVHDLRRTGASHMAQLRIPRTVIKKILNHTDRDVTAIYDRYSYDDEKRDALDAWARRLHEIVKKDELSSPIVDSAVRLSSIPATEEYSATLAETGHA